MYNYTLTQSLHHNQDIDEHKVYNTLCVGPCVWGDYSVKMMKINSYKLLFFINLFVSIITIHDFYLHIVCLYVFFKLIVQAY